MHQSVATSAVGPAVDGRIFGKEDRLPLLVLCALCLVLFFFRLGAVPLWDVDEGLHAATSKDMVLTGDWVTTTFNGKNFYDKTALFNWMVAASYEAFGFTEFASRLPAALLGTGIVLLTYLLGKRLFGSAAGLMAGVILATSPEFIVLSRSVVHDISLAFFVTATFYFFHLVYSTDRNRQRNLILFYASAGFAVLAKGPIGVVLPGMAIFLFLLLRKRLGFLRQMSLGRGIVMFLAVAAPWYVLISIRNSDYVSYFVLHQNIGNFLSKVQARHPEPFYYYVPALLGGMLPWSFFILPAVISPLSNGIRKVGEAELFLICWFLTIFLFFSAAHSKLATYLLPAYPGVALLVARSWQQVMTGASSGLRKAMAWGLAALPSLLLGAAAYIAVRKPRAAKLQAKYGTSLNDLNTLLIVLGLILALALVLFLVRKYRSSFTALAATFAIGFLAALVVYIPAINPYRSTKTIAKQMDELLPPGAPLVMYWNRWESPLFYANRHAVILHSEKELLDYLSSGQTTLCIIDREQYQALPQVAAKSRIIGQEGNKLLLAGTVM